MRLRLSYLIIAALISVGARSQKYVGGDISLLTKYETNGNGANYADHSGKAITSPLSFFKDEGWNLMRVRLFVDPANASDIEKGEGVCQDLEYVKALGKRIKDAGFSFMLDFHYSDTWADPAKQWTPKDWLALSNDQMYDRIYTYTKSVLEALVAAGATPDFIQTGNEISYGMLWGDVGSTSYKCNYASSTNWPRFVTLLKRAGQACREVCPQAKIVLHSERVAEPSSLTYFYNKMASGSVDYDIIGLSYYPYFHGDLSKLESALTTVETAYPDKKIMIVEAGYPYAWEVPGTTFDYSSVYPYSDEGQKKFTEDLIAKLNAHANVNGLIWWWPEANENGLDWETQRVTNGWYNSSLFDGNTGRATSALSSLRKFVETGTGITSAPADIRPADATVYTLDGRRADSSSALSKGIYIIGGKKIVVR